MSDKRQRFDLVDLDDTDIDEFDLTEPDQLAEYDVYVEEDEPEVDDEMDDDER